MTQLLGNQKHIAIARWMTLMTRFL